MPVTKNPNMKLQAPTPRNIYIRVRKSFIETKIHKMNEEINAIIKENNGMFTPKSSEIENKKRDLINQYNKLDN